MISRHLVTSFGASTFGRRLPTVQHQPHQKRTSSLISRMLSSVSSKKSTISRDTRLAGRPRFYKEVGVTSVEAPWESFATKKPRTRNERFDDDGNPAALKSNEGDRVASPISAGVDGTDSASGVGRLKLGVDPIEAMKTTERMLSPRPPGTMFESMNATSTASGVDAPDHASQKDSWFGITLDGRVLKTPLGKTLAVPSETLAHGIAAEWNAQSTALKPTDMPLMTLACTALDQAVDHPNVYREQALNFLPTDTACFWADPIEDRVLHRRQEEAWKELHEFVERRWGAKAIIALGAQEAMLMSRKRGDAKPFVGLPHPPDLFEEAKKWTESLDAWHLVALASCCSQSKSFLVAWAMMESPVSLSYAESSPLRHIPNAIAASRVEEEFQISNWGLVEGGHDYDRLNCSIQLHSAKFLVKAISLDNDFLLPKI